MPNGMAKLKRPSEAKAVHQSCKEGPSNAVGQGLQRQELKVFDTALAFNFDATGEIPLQDNSVSFKQETP